MPFYDITDGVVQLLGIARKIAGSATLSGDGSLTSSGVRKRSGTAGLFGDSEVSITTPLRKAAGTSDLSIDLSVTSNGFVLIGASSDLVLPTSLTANGRATLEAHMTGASDVTLSGGAERRTYSDSALFAQSLISSTANAIVMAVAAPGFQSALAATGTKTLIGASSLTGESDMAVTAHFVQYGTSEILGSQGELIGDGVIVQYGDVYLTAESSMPAVTAEPVYRLILKTVKQAITDDWMLKRYPIDVGLSLLVTGSAVVEAQVPSQTELSEADYYFLGGHHHQITQQQRDTLVAAGYGSYIEEA